MTAVEQDYAAPGRYRDAFASGEFRALSGAYAVAMLGRVVAGLALTVLIYRQTGSPLLSALAFTLEFVPYLFGGTLLSGLVDRVPPRRLMAGCDLSSAVAVAVAVMAVPGMPLPAMFVLLSCVGLAAPLSTGTRGGLLPELMSPGAVVPARAVIRLIAQTSQIAGYAAGGLLLVAVPPRALLVADAVALALSALVIRAGLGPRPALAAAATRSLARDSFAGVRDVLAIRGLRPVLALTCFAPFLFVVPEGLAAPAVTRAGQPASAAGYWLTAVALGSVAGQTAGVWAIPGRRRARSVRPLAAAGFLPAVAFFGDPPFPLMLALLAAGGLCTVYFLGLDQLVLELTPPDLLPRVFTVSSSGLMATQGLGFALGGALGEWLPPPYAIGMSGLAGLALVACVPLRTAREGGSG